MGVFVMNDVRIARRVYIQSTSLQGPAPATAAEANVPTGYHDAAADADVAAQNDTASANVDDAATADATAYDDAHVPGWSASDPATAIPGTTMSIDTAFRKTDPVVHSFWNRTTHKETLFNSQGRTQV